MKMTFFTPLVFLVGILIAVLLFVAHVRYLESVSIFHPSEQILATPDIVGLDFEDIYFKAEDDVRLNGWLIKHPQAKSTLLYFHGNAGNISERLEKITTFHRMGLNVFIVDYRGYGKSEGKPTEEGMYRDAVAAFDYLTTRRDLKGKPVIVYGASLGGVAAIDLATRRKIDALIIDSSFSSVADMCKRLYPFIPTFLLNLKMDSVAKVRNILIPKLFIHSIDDEVVPFKLGQKLFDAAAEPKELLKITGTHNEAHLESHEYYIQNIEAFLKKAGHI